MQYIFQSPYASLNPRKQVRQMLGQAIDRFVALSHAERRLRMVGALKAAALDETFLDRFPSELSGGERQRVALARALVVEPEVLVCDEVTSALDVSVQAAIVETLRTLRIERAVTILFITHNLALVRSVASRVLVLQDGEVVETGVPEEVLDRPRHPYTQQLLADLPRLEAGRPLLRTRNWTANEQKQVKAQEVRNT